MLRRPAHVTRRRVAAHACPDCRRLWALRGVRTDTGTWLISCAYCGWSDVRTTGADRRRVVPAQRDTQRRAEPGTVEHGATGGGWSHGVLLYSHDDELLTALLDHLVAGWSAGRVGLVIATPGHRAALRDRLDALGLTATLGAGRLVQLDAASTLEQFVVDGVPDPVRFGRTVGSLVREHAADGGLHGFGEMVDLLWADGNAVGALELERLWSGLQEQVAFSLLCAYATDHVDPRDRPTITGAHDHVLG